MKDRVFIIAEAGVNHNGDIGIAKKLIDAAVSAGADAVKFQSFKTENLLSKDAQKADYQKENTSQDESQFDMIKKLELSTEAHKTLIAHCKQKNIMFLSTPFDHDSIDLLYSLGLTMYKIPSGEITNLPYLRQIGTLGKQIILSTGMSHMTEIKAALDILIQSGTKKENITILHANTEYPTPMSDVNLLAMKTIGETFAVSYGYSDHTLGIEVPIAAVALGACVIEKHFTLNKTMEGPDHKASLEPTELKQMVQAIRNIELALGSSIKQPSKSEAKNSAIARKSIHVNEKILKGDTISLKQLIMKRPGDGISPMDIESIIGKKVISDLEPDHKLSWEDVI